MRTCSKHLVFCIHFCTFSCLCLSLRDLLRLKVFIYMFFSLKYFRLAFSWKDAPDFSNSQCTPHQIENFFSISFTPLSLCPQTTEIEVVSIPTHFRLSVTEGRDYTNPDPQQPLCREEIRLDLLKDCLLESRSCK